MSDERVIYYGGGDMCYGLGFDKIETLAVPTFESIDINDAIEYFQLHKYFKDGARAKNWTDDDYACFLEKSNRLWGLTNRFVNNISDSNIVSEYEKIELNYASEFWELFDSNRLSERISDASFRNLLKCKYVPLANILEHKSIVKKYGASLREYILRDFACVGLLLRFYEQDHTDHKRIFIPDELTGIEIVDLFSRYLDSNQVNANHAKDILYMQSTKRFPIDDRLRLKAKKRYEKEFEMASVNGISIRNTIGVAISKEQTKEIDVSFVGANINASYSYQWFADTLDYSSILNNFIYLFDYADFQQMRCTLVSNSRMGSVLERTIFHKDSDQYYNENHGFFQINGLASLQMSAYCAFLNENGIRFEDVLQWFFTEYLQKEFGCPEIRIALPSENTPLLQKCESICTAIEIAVKQFASFANTGTIDFELLQISSGSPKYDQIPSLVEKKYIYGTGNEYEWIDYLLFSDQCPLYFVSKANEGVVECNSFLELIQRKKVRASIYHDKYRSFISKLAELDLVRINGCNEIEVGDQIKLTILQDLHYHEVISRWHYPDSAQAVFRELIDKGILVEDSTLLSRPEANYFSYMLNREKYCNGPQLRNQYMHGNGQLITDDRIHKQNYLELLKLMVILIIKINEEFCLHETLNKEGNEGASPI